MVDERGNLEVRLDMPAELVAEVDRLAKATLRTRPAMVRWLVKMGLDAEETIFGIIPIKREEIADATDQGDVS
jgi:predicted transcriptional regulator